MVLVALSWHTHGTDAGQRQPCAGHQLSCPMLPSSSCHRLALGKGGSMYIAWRCCPAGVCQRHEARLLPAGKIMCRSILQLHTCKGDLPCLMIELGSVLGASLSIAHRRQDNGKTKVGYCTAEKCRQRVPLGEYPWGLRPSASTRSGPLPSGCQGQLELAVRGEVSQTQGFACSGLSMLGTERYNCFTPSSSFNATLVILQFGTTLRAPRSASTSALCRLVFQRRPGGQNSSATRYAVLTVTALRAASPGWRRWGDGSGTPQGALRCIKVDAWTGTEHNSVSLLAESTRMQGPLLCRAKAVAYVALNIGSGTSIVFMNKLVFSVLGFSYIYALAFVHTAVTAMGMWGFGWCGVFEPKPLPLQSILPLAGSFLGYIVFWNLSLRMNPVGFYQLSKIMITPTVVALEVALSSKWPSKAEQAAIVTLCAGVSLATITDPHLQADAGGLLVGAAAVFFAAVYQV